MLTFLLFLHSILCEIFTKGLLGYVRVIDWNVNKLIGASYVRLFYTYSPASQIAQR